MVKKTAEIFDMMENAGTNESFISVMNYTLAFRAANPCLEICNVLLLSVGVLAMYHGIEIQHPLYLVLFVNLIVPLISTVSNLLLFPFISFDKFIKVRHFFKSKKKFKIIL